ncbi:MAG: SAM-dependent methyltransferase [Chloroflexota bacterium]
MTEFESVTENAALNAAIIARIQANYGISFRDFMAMALYHPGLGYYSGVRDPIGRDADYVTSPELSPIFGAMLGRQLREMWQLLSSPTPFDIVEVGAGSGVLARDILSWCQRTAPDLAAATRYTIIEPHEPAVTHQRERLAADGLADRVTWATELPAPITGVILSNELLDAMPVHRVVVENGTLHETYVTYDDSQFQQELRDPSPDLTAYFERLGLLPGEGNRAEVNLAALDWVRAAATSLTRGFLLTIDYGYDALDLYASWRTDGTLLAFYRQNASGDLYARIGRQDLTSHVDFTSIRRTGEDAGLQTLGLTSQSEFLANLGIAEALAAPPDATSLEEYAARRRAITELLDPGGLGRIRVLVQAKDVIDVTLTGLRDTT